MLMISTFFVLGVVFGSFFHVIGQRVPVNESFLVGRSICRHCERTLNWYELIPVASFVLLRRKCGHCHHPISWTYPIIELLTGCLFAFSYQHIGFNLELLSALLLVSLLIIVLVSDLQYMLIPNSILFYFLLLFIFLQMQITHISIWNNILGGITGFAIIAVIILLSQGGMGGGDMKLFGLLGFILGIKKVLFALFLSSINGAIIGTGYLLLAKIELKEPIPFSPFIVIGTMISFYYGDMFLNWYGSFLR
ncbi:A24 family peptidase [Virgibacillus sp. LDC-1]|uniref:prepilin peptidase n=1 Tax=Virgibacillus sp. LDC-1 TaxID=3039856 RepID=UPI0024DDFF1C|nr:A24 family peptidase [Virgibacillus sp. LDC-1]